MIKAALHKVINNEDLTYEEAVSYTHLTLPTT